MINAVAEIGDQVQLRPGAADQRRIEIVGDGGHQHVGARHRRGQPGAIERDIRFVELDVEQLGHPRLHAVGQPPGDDHLGMMRAGGIGHRAWRLARHAAGVKPDA